MSGTLLQPQTNLFSKNKSNIDLRIEKKEFDIHTEDCACVIDEVEFVKIIDLKTNMSLPVVDTPQATTAAPRKGIHKLVSRIFNRMTVLPLTMPLCLVLLLGVLSVNVGWGQTNNYFGTSGTISGSVWSTSVGGPYNTALVTTGGSILNFNNAGSATGATIATCVGINFGASITWAAGGTIGAAGINLPINVSAGVNQNLTSNFSTAATAAYTKNGAGALLTSGGTYGGGFTLNDGALIAGGINAMGGNAIPGLLTLNGGTVAANGNRVFSGKYSNIVIGGNIQFGEMSTVISLASSTSNLTFSNNMSLGSVNRTFTLGNGGNMGFGGVISNTGSNGLTFTANSNGTGRFDITGTNTFSGPVNINGNGTGVAEVRFTSDGSLGNTSNTININGGRLSTLSAASYTLTSGRGIQVGNTAGTSISTPGAGVLTYNGIIADLSGSIPGAWSKQGSGTLSLGGVSTYTGATSINNGTLQLTTGNDRLPTTTVLSLGQSASLNLGTLDLNGRNQTIAGLNSTTGSASAMTNVGLNNTITSSVAATLTVSGSGTYGAATDANSGIIAGAISLVKSGTGTLTLGDVNTYAGTTTINGGTLTLSGAGSIANSSAITVGSGGTFDVSGLTTALSLGASQSLKSSATGANTTATITVASSKGITLSAGGLEFTAYGGGATAPLTISGASAGALDLNNAPVTLTTSTELAVGTYKLIAKSGSATVTGTPGTLTMAGSLLASNTTGELSIVSGELILTVTAVEYTVTFNGNSNTGGTMSNQTASSATNLTSNSFIRTGYTFGGWATSSGSATVAYANGDSYPFDASTTLHAIWTANTLTVTYDSQGGSAISNGSTTTGGTVSNPGNPTLNGYTFNGWFVANTGGSAISFPYTHGQTADLTLYAQWTLAGSPAISGAATASAFTTTYGTASSPQSFPISGSALTNDIIATAPTGFEVSSDGTTYGSIATFTQSSGNASGTLYIKLAATATVSGTYDSQNIVLSSTGASSSVNITTAASGNTVAQKALAITTATVASKVYNRSTTCGTVTPGALSGFVGSETVVVSSAAGTYADWNVGTGKTATISYTLGNGTNGGLAANYSLANTIATGDITAKALTVTSPAVTSKTYDGNTNASITGSLSGVESGDAVTLTGTGTFVTANVGTGISVTSTSTLGGADAGNYSLTQPTGLSGDITGASQTITFASLTPATLSTADYSPGATASSGLTVTYTSSNPCVASIVSGNIHIIGAGATTITASQSGGGNYTAATSVDQTLVVQSSFNPTSTLTAGDVALLGINSANPDKFSMVFLKDVAQNVAINFTDNGFTATTTTRPGEGFLTYTVPSGGHAAGTVITWNNGMTITGTGWSSAAPNNMAFNGSGDQLFVFSGNTANWSTLSGITLLYGLNYGKALSGTSDAANTVQPSTTLLPATSWLNLGTSSYANTYFANATTSTSSVTVSGLASTLLSYFVDGANKWYANSTAAATFPSYLINTVSPSPLITTSGTLSAVSTTYGTASTSPTNFSVSSSNLTADLTLTAPSGFEISSGSSYATSLTISPDACGAIAATSIDVRLAATTAVGTYSGNIVLSSTGATSVNMATVSSTVSAKSLTIIDLTATDKTYDGLTTVTVSGTPAYSGLVNSESFSVSGTVSWAFPNATVENNKTLTRTGNYAAPSANYTVTQPTLSASITARSLTITANDVNKAFGATLAGSSGSNAFVSNGLQNGETIGSVTIVYGNGAASTDAVGTYTGEVTPSAAIGGTFTAANYSISYVAGNIIVSSVPTLNPVTLTSALSTTYGTASTGVSFVASGSNLSTNITVTAQSGYQVSDDNTSFGSSVSVSSGTTVYVRFEATQAAGTYNNATAVVLSYAGATDVNISTSSSGNSVSAKALTISGISISNKVYDGNATATISGTAAYSGLVNGDSFAVSGTPSATFSDENVGNNKTITVIDYTSPSSNYSFSQPSGLLANITTATLTLTSAAVSSKVYDGTTVATITGTLSGVISPDVVTLVGTGTFASANIGTGISVTSIATLSGADAGNYSLTQPTGLSGNITQGTQTITFSSFTTPITVSTTIVASSNFGSAISYSSSNTSVATINSSTGVVTIVGNGTTTITASNAGNSNYTAASTSQVLTVNPTTTSLVTFDFVGIAGNEATVNSNSTATGIASSTVSRGSGLTANGNADRFNATSWATSSIANAISGNDYVEFTVTPNSGFQFSVSSILFQIQRSATGLTAIALRSSLDSYASNLDAQKSVIDNTATQSFTFTFSQSNSSSAVTYRLYGYSESGTGTGGPGDGTGNDIVVNGIVSCLTPSQSSAISGTTTVCSGSAQSYSVTNVSGVGYTWSLPDGSWSGSSTSNLINSTVGSTEGTISVTPYNAASGCSNYTASSQSISVTVNATPNAPTASAQSFCSSASPTVADLTATGTAIQWYDASTNGNLVASETALTAGNYYASQTVSSCESATRTSVAVTVNANGTWIGDSNDDWNNANNWCGGIPNSNSIVVSIPSGVTVNLDTSPSVSELTLASTSVINAGSNILTIANGGTLTNNGTFNSQTGTVVFAGTGTLAGNATTFNNLTTSGNLTLGASQTINGTLTLSSGTLTVGANTLTVNGNISRTSGNIDASNNSATVIFGGSTSQTIPASTFTGDIKNLTLNNSAGLSISQDLSVVGALALTSGKLTLGSNHLTLGLNASIGGSPHTASNMIIATGLGELRKRFAQGSGDITSFTFPVGNGGGVAEYTRIVLDFASGNYGANAFVGVRVQDSKQGTLNSSITNYLDRNWIVEPNDITGYSYKIQLHYVDADFVTDGSMAEGDLKPIKISSGQWYQPTDGSFTNAVSQGSAGIFASENYLEWNGLTTFSEFGGAGGSNQPLPVELLSFTAECANESIILKWQTASEFNSSHFDVEKSTDGLNWNTIGQLPAAGNSNELLSYSLEDASKRTNTSYYRLNQVDIDGLQKYYGPISPMCETINHLNGKTIPNPSNNEFWLQISSAEQQKITYLLQDINGTKILENMVELLPGSNIFPIRETIPAGMYFIILQTEKGQQQVIKHIRN